MPIYEYRCGSCGFQKEFLQKISDAPLTDCPECGKPELNKLVTAAGFQLKGSGWYVTDFRNGSKPATKSDKSADKSASAKSDDKSSGSDAKPAAKEEAKPASTETAAAKPAPAAESAN